MKPSSVALELRRIASALDNSKSPSRELVANDLRNVISKLSSDPVIVSMRTYDGDRSPINMMDEVDALYNNKIKGPGWFSMHDAGWIAVNTDPSTLTRDTPVAGGMYGPKTWGEVLDRINPGSLNWKRMGSLINALHDPKYMDFLTTYGETDKVAEFIDALEQHNLSTHKQLRHFGMS